MNTVNTPINEVELALWFVLESDPVLRQYVKPGNRLSYLSSSTNPEKQAQEAGDAPEILVFPSGGSLFDSGSGTSSSSWSVKQKFVVAISTDERRTNVDTRGIGIAKWALMQCLNRMRRDMEGFNKNTPSQCVKKIDAVSFTDSPRVDEQATQRIITGWQFLCEITFSLVFDNLECEA